jgi:transposase
MIKASVVGQSGSGDRRLGELSQLDGEPHKKAACELRAHKVYGRYVRQTRTGKLRLNKAKCRAEEFFDGKFLVSSSDDGLAAEDIALGYKQLAVVERVFRDLKHTVDIRPVYHRLEVWQTNPVTAEAKLVFDTLGVKPPPRYYALPTPRPNRV